MSIQLTENFEKGWLWRKGFHFYSIEIDGEERDSCVKKNKSGQWVFTPYGDVGLSESLTAKQLLQLHFEIGKLNNGGRVLAPRGK